MPHAVEILEPMTKDGVDFVRQGAFIMLGMILFQQSEVSPLSMSSTRALYTKIVSDKHEDPIARFGAAIGQGLHALGEWDQLAAQVDENWSNANDEDRHEIAPMAAAAAWSLREWDSMDDYIIAMRADSPDRAFYKAILPVRQNQFPKAFKEIGKVRDLLEPELTSFIGEGYGRSYK